jgi:hypothetical protein
VWCLLLEGFSTHKSAIEALHNYSVKTQAAALRGLKVRKIAVANKTNENRSVRKGQSELANRLLVCIVAFVMVPETV